MDWLEQNFDTLFTHFSGNPSPGHGEAECYTHNTTGRKLVRRLVYGDISLYETLQAVDHPALLSIYEVLPCGDGFAVFEEYPEGVRLSDLLKNGRLNEKKSVAEFIRICEGVAALHAAGVAHGAILPDSILVGKRDGFKLCDYGSASLFSHYSDLDDTALLPHTAPSATPSPFVRRDILSLGVLLNLLLTGAYPETYLYRGRYTPVIRTCISCDPAKRFASVTELCRRLREVF